MVAAMAFARDPKIGRKFRQPYRRYRTVTDATYGEADAALSDTETRDEEAANALVPQAMGRFRAASQRPRTSLRRATPRRRFAPTNRIWRAFEKWCDGHGLITPIRARNFRSWQTIDRGPLSMVWPVWDDG
jgi:hypothetical protein